MVLGIGNTTEDEGTIQVGIVLRVNGETGCLTHDNLIKRGLGMCSKYLCVVKTVKELATHFYIVG